MSANISYGYWDGIVADRSVLLDIEDSLQGMTLISVEAQADLADGDIMSYANEHPGNFFRFLARLSLYDRDLLASYYFLHRTQAALAGIYGTTQTMVSFQQRMAVHRLCWQMIIAGHEQQEVMAGILSAANWEHLRANPTPMSKLITAVVNGRSWSQVARLHPSSPTPRKLARSMCSELLTHAEATHVALAAYVHALIYHTHLNTETIHRKDPDILGEWAIRIDDPDFPSMFVLSARQ